MENKDWQAEYNNLVVKTSAQLNDLTLKLNDTTSKLANAEKQVKEYRESIVSQEKVMKSYRQSLVELTAFKAINTLHESDFKDNLEWIRKQLIPKMNGEFVCEKCGRKFPSNADMVMYEPYKEEVDNQFVLTILCENCADESHNDV